MNDRPTVIRKTRGQLEEQSDSLLEEMEHPLEEMRRRSDCSLPTEQQLILDTYEGVRYLLDG